MASKKTVAFIAVASLMTIPVIGPLLAFIGSNYFYFSIATSLFDYFTGTSYGFYTYIIVSVLLLASWIISQAKKRKRRTKR